MTFDLSRASSPGYAVAGLALLLLVLIDRPAAAAPPAPRATTLVTTSPVRTVQWPDLVSASGTIEAWQEAIVGSQSPGLRLVEVRAQVGDVVRKGSVLARFDDGMLKAEEARLLAEQSQAEAQSAQADANLLRAQVQQEAGGISDQEVLAARTRAKVAAGQADAARAQLQAKRLQLGYAEVRAPGDGVISARRATLGMLGDGGQELFRVVLGSRLEWRGQLTAVQLQRVSVGQVVEVALPTGDAVSGRVRQKSPLIDPGSRLGTVYVDLPAKTPARAGMFAKGSVSISTSAARVVPARSLVARDGRIYVFATSTTAGPGKVQMVNVTTGRRQGSDIEILTGLNAGAAVVSEGAGFLDDGEDVRIAPSPVATVPASGARP